MRAREGGLDSIPTLTLAIASHLAHLSHAGTWADDAGPRLQDVLYV